MTVTKDSNAPKLSWVVPEIRELDVMETFTFPNRGADARGNPYIDCQRS